MPAPLFPGVSDDDILAALRASGANLAPPPEQLAAEVAAAPPPQPSPFFPSSQVAAPPPASVETQMPPMDMGAPDQGAIPEPLGMPHLPQLNPTDVAGAERQQQDVLGSAAAAHTRSLEGTMVAQNNQLGRQAGVESDYANRQARLDTDFQVAREAAHQRAAAETAGWLRQMDTLANTEPNHQRFWQNQDRFGKGLWLLGMAFSSAALIGTQSAGQRRNPVLEMLKQEIDSDVQDQKDSLAKRGAALKTKGDLMLRGQDQSMADLRDDHSMAYQRLESLKRGALLKAQQLPDGDVRKLAMLQGADWADQQLMGVVNDKAQRAVTLHEGAANRANSMAQAKMTDQRERDLAAISAGVKLAAAQGEAGKDDRVLPTSTGVYRRDPTTGKTVPLTVNKDRYEAVAQQAQLWSDQARALGKLHSTLTDSSTSEEILKNDVALRSAITEAVAPAAKMVNGGRGPLTDQDYSRGAVNVLGYDPDSLLSMAKRSGGKEAVMRLLEGHIRDIPKRAAHDIGTVSGVQLAEGDLTFVAPDLSSPDVKEPTRQAALSAGGKAEGGAHPKSVTDYLAAKKTEAETGNEVLPKLPSDLRDKLKDFETNTATAPPRTVHTLHEGVNRAIDDWKASQLAVGKDPKAVEAEADDARTRAAGIASENVVAGRKKFDQVVDAVTTHEHLQGHEFSRGEVIDVAKRVGLGQPDPDELDELMAAVRAKYGPAPLNAPSPRRH